MSVQYKPFKLLRLPYLASCHIIRNMDLIDLIPLAVQSKRAKRLVKMCSQIDTVNLHFDGDFLRIYHDFQSVLSSLTNMEQDIIELEGVVDFLIDIFKSPTFSIDLKVNGSTKGILNFLETVKDLKIDRLSVAVREVYIDDVYEKILTDFQDLEEFEIDGEMAGCAWKHVTIKNESDSLSTVLWDIEHEPVAKANLDGSIQRFYVDTCAVIKHYYGIRALVFLDYKNCVLTLSTDFNLDVEPEDYLEEDEEDGQIEEEIEEVAEEDLGQQGREQEIREEAVRWLII